MATFNSLPAECLGLVLALASECDTSCPVSHLVALRTLAVSSLVAQGWREPAQARMWRSLYIWRVGTAAHIAASPICGKFRTARVELGAGALGVNETLGETLGKLVGVESIEIDGEDGWEDEEEHRLFDDAWVNLPSLSNLRSLRLRVPFVDALLDDLKPVFRLHTLELGPATNSPSLVSSLFETSSSTLSILYLHDLDPSLDPILLSSLPLVANNLTTLNIVGLSLFSTFGPTFSTFNSLTEIGTSLGTLPDLDALDSLLAALDPPLAALRLIFFPAPFREEGVLEGVTNRMGKDGWMGFQRAFVPERLDDLFADPGGPGFFKQCVEMEVMIGTEDFAETYMYKV